MNLISTFPKDPYPTGWFIIGRSSDLAPGGVQALEYFGEKLVLWRGADSGQVYCQDAFCLHLGAHRGIRGWVTGDDITCPWHGWQWDKEGKNSCIPYGSRQTKKGVKARVYPVTEWCGNIMIWYAPEEGEPTWELPEVVEHGQDGWYPDEVRTWDVKCHPQHPVENACDFAHIHYIHGSTDPARQDYFRTYKHLFFSKIDVLYGGGKDKTFLTPNGGKIASFRTVHAGLPIAIIRWDDELWPTVLVTCFTPIDDKRIRYFFQLFSKRGEGETGDEWQGRAARMLKLQLKVAEEDFFIWENMKTMDAPAYELSETGPYTDLRHWASQFYPSTAASYVPDPNNALLEGEGDERTGRITLREENAA